jgi:CRISPR-associated protein Cmr2
MHADSARKRLRKYPSTAYMAALPWLLKTIDSPEGTKAVEKFAEAVRGAATKQSDLDAQDSIPAEWQIKPLLTQAEQHTRLGLVLPDFPPALFDLDGTLFYEEGIARRQTELQANQERDLTRASSEQQAQEIQTVRALQKALGDLQNATAPDGGRRQRKMQKASPFYAVLRMDGDNIGQALLEGKSAEISAALAGFTQAAGRILSNHYGLPLYVGGDDVLALLPLHTALLAAEALRVTFFEYMNGLGPTLSAGLVFSHYTMPLGMVLDCSKEMLEREAKAANGRDSLALLLLKGAGETARFVRKWELQRVKTVPILSELVDAFAEQDERSSSFLYNLESRLADLFRDATMGGLNKAQLSKLILAERLLGQETEAIKAVEAEVAQLMALCYDKEKPFRLDAALIAKFLADNGGWYTRPAAAEAG